MWFLQIIMDWSEAIDAGACPKAAADAAYAKHSLKKNGADDFTDAESNDMKLMPSNVTPSPEPDDDEDDRAPEFSDDALALDFVDQSSDGLRYVAKWGTWLRWGGTVWGFDETLNTFDHIRKVCRAAARIANKGQKKITSAPTVANVEKLAKADRRVAATTDQWDTDLWLLNTPEGTIDLRTGEKRANAPDDYITKITAVTPNGNCPLFRKFLDRITDSDTELQDFLQRIFGYSLTGSTQEHALFFLYGLGSNGKSVLLETISGILGDYTEVAPVETFTASKNERHPTDIAKLRGARFVTAVETEEGRFWAEAKIKSLTGGDKQTARFMRGNYFDYVPAFKLFIAGNHKPRLKNVDEAIRRRFNLVPFTVTIPPEERDLDLTEKLKAEWPGIFQWMIKGCMEWQKLDGLCPPKCVLDATTEYLEGEDAMAAWIDEECELDRRKADSSTTLYNSWKEWADRAGEYSGSQKDFSQRMAARGFEKKKLRRGAQFIGIVVAATSKLSER